jgi:hypothetical protein
MLGFAQRVETRCYKTIRAYGSLINDIVTQKEQTKTEVWKKIKTA